MAATRRDASIRGVAYLLLLALVVLLSEAFSYAFLTMDLPGIRSRVYLPPRISAAAFGEYLAIRDPVLGWPSKLTTEKRLDRRGARISPANEALADQPACVSLYGDSYTFSDEVGNAAAWGNVLAELLECPVANFGMFGFGVDQAVLRFRTNDRDDASLTILGITPFDLSRNMNQWRHLATGDSAFGFKPTFEENGSGGLDLVPIPVNDYATFQQVATDPAAVLRNESLLPDRPSLRSPISIGPPYTISLVRFMMKLAQQYDPTRFSIRYPAFTWLYPPWYDTHEGPSKQSLHRNFLIVEAFTQDCQDRGRVCVVLTIPTAHMLLERTRNDRADVAPIFGDIGKISELWDPTGNMLRQIADDEPCQFVGKKKDCIGHYNDEGYRLLADVVLELVHSYPEACRSDRRLCR